MIKLKLWVVIAMLGLASISIAGIARADDSIRVWVGETPQRVDLRRWQVPGLPSTSGRPDVIRSQFSRYSCITFSTTAALEAAVKRAGFGSHDISEEFMNYLGKMFWLHPNWDQDSPGRALKDLGANHTENQVAAFSGGGGVGYLEYLASGFRIPVERLMPYRVRGYNPPQSDWQNPIWKNQKNASDFNLAESNLPPAALSAPSYFGIRRMSKLANPRNSAEYERVLAAGYEIVVDRSNHSVLVVGYDKRDPDPAKHYFIVKDSAARNTTAGSQGYMYQPYSYVRNVAVAGFIVAVERPKNWRELAFIGSWKLSLDGQKGRLDIYHLPGMAQLWLDQNSAEITDRRIGTYYNAAGTAFRVNGSVDGNRITFYIDSNEPNLRWDKLTGRHFEYAIFPSKRLMAGYHVDPDGKTWGGYATKDDFILPDPRPDPYRGVMVAESWRGSWNLNMDTVVNGIVRITYTRPRSAYGVYGADFRGEWRVRGAHHDISNERNVTPPLTGRASDKLNKIRFSLAHALGIRNPDSFMLTGYRLSFEPDVVTGLMESTSGQAPFVMIRRPRVGY